MAHPLRHFVVLKANRDVLDRYFSDGADEWLTQYVAQHVYDQAVDKPPFRTVARPSGFVFSGPEPVKEPPVPNEVVVALEAFHDKGSGPREVVDLIIEAVAKKTEIFTGSSSDIPFAGADHWCGEGADPIFSDRAGIERLLGVDYLRKQSKTTGKGVNVVVVDQGLDAHALGNNYGGGWSVGNATPGSPPRQLGSVRLSHGMMIANNILKVAPEAKLFDLPLAPAKISNIQTFLHNADAALRIVLNDIASWKTGPFPGPWILVNPWGIFDRRSEYPKGSYTQGLDPNNSFIKLMRGAVNSNIDVLFSAGNCGQFCPDERCGATDQGPGRSIWGANSLAEVLTVGAVRADTMWLGYSSQGPGQPLLGSNKPDLCAASQFCENGDAFSINTGTSAACGMTGGILAALRSRWDSTTVSPGDLKTALNKTARKPRGLQWGNDLGYRLGNGILDARAAFDALKAQFP